jgi:hypothetical protein
MDQHLSSPDTALLRAEYGENRSDGTDLCFAKWDKIFYFSGQQWLRVHSAL